MKASSGSGTISVERREELLLHIPGFTALPAALRQELARGMREEHFPAGTNVIAEGQIGDRLYLIDHGTAEVSTPGAIARVLLAELEDGDLFGEIALVSTGHRRQATVTALTPLSTLSLSAEAFEKALAACPEARIDVATTAETLLTAKFLKQQGSWGR